MKQKRIKVRFNLAYGAHRFQWQIRYPDGQVVYHTPSLVQLIMQGCELKNNKKTAQKIFEGSEKVVCAWILCDHVVVRRKDTEEIISLHKKGLTEVKYNPRIQPNWTLNERDVDGMNVQSIGSVEKNLYIIY